jgi:hypothetical protein
MNLILLKGTGLRPNKTFNRIPLIQKLILGEILMLWLLKKIAQSLEVLRDLFKKVSKSVSTSAIVVSPVLCLLRLQSIQLCKFLIHNLLVEIEETREM